MRSMKKFLGVLLTLVLVLGLISPVRAIAEEEMGEDLKPDLELEQYLELEKEPPSFPRAYDDWLWYDFLMQPTEIPGRLVLDERTFFTQEELRDMIPPLEVREFFAAVEPRSDLIFNQDIREKQRGYYPASWVSRPHPDRPMTPEELEEWIEEYRLLGGLNVFELEVIYLINQIRLDHDLVPLTICPYLSMAARLGSQLRLRSHWDPHYGRPGHRAYLFAPHLIDAGNTVGENTTAGVIPEHSVNSWMNSPGHRLVILLRWNRYIGVGQNSAGQVVLKVTRR